MKITVLSPDSTQVGPLQITFHKVGLGKIRPGKIRPGKIRGHEHATNQAHTGEMNPNALALAHHHAIQRRSGKIDPVEIDLHQSGVDDPRSLHAHLGQAGHRKHSKLKVDLIQIRPIQAATAERHILHYGAGHAAAGESCGHRAHFRQISTGKIGRLAIALDERNSGQIGRSEIITPEIHSDKTRAQLTGTFEIREVNGRRRQLGKGGRVRIGDDTFGEADPLHRRSVQRYPPQVDFGKQDHVKAGISERAATQRSRRHDSVRPRCSRKIQFICLAAHDLQPFELSPGQVEIPEIRLHEYRAPQLRRK